VHWVRITLAIPTRAETIELRKTICDYLTAARAVRCDPEQVVVTAGTQQALDIVIRVLPSRDKEVWIEDPCYP